MIFVFQAEEEARSLQKKIQAIENDLDQTQEALMQVNAKLDEKDKSLQIVSTYLLFIFENLSLVPIYSGTRIGFFDISLMRLLQIFILKYKITF